jgi:hypothetical protein
MKKILLLLSFASFASLALLAPLAALAATQAIECPASIDMKSLVKAPPGWVAVESPDRKGLDRIGLFSGHPSENASLAPDSSNDTKDDSTNLWTFEANSTEQIWAACSYRGTNTILAKQVVKGVRSCTVRYKRANKLLLGVIAASCKN